MKLEDSHYFKPFSRLQLEGPDLFKLRGNSLIVEKLELVENKTSGGIILATDQKQALHSMKDKEAVLCLVLMVGSGFEGEPKTDIEVGNLILAPRFALEYYSTFPGLMGLTKERIGRVNTSEVSFLYKDIEAFEKASQMLNT